MQRLISDLKGYAIGAKDGDIGAVDDFLFDDELWTVRYLVADTAKWLPGRRVLISPIALRHLEPNEERLPVSLTKEQVKNSPDLDSRNLSREHEASYYNYYGWPYYWIGGDVWGQGTTPADLATWQPVETQTSPQSGEEPHLRSASEVTGYYIEAKDGDLGHVEDFVVDDETWEIRYIVVDTKNWWTGKQVLVSPEWIDRVSWSDSRVYVDLSREMIKSAPEFNPKDLGRGYDERLHKHYDRPGYWNT